MWATALLIGMMGSLHCVGMCGPIALILPLDRVNRRRMLSGLISYHAGRISTYALLGAMFGLLGKGLFLAGIQQQVSVVIGVLMVLSVFLPKLLKSLKRVFAFPYKLLGFLQGKWGSRLKGKRIQDLFALGLINGLLPCGLVYMALFGALTQSTILSGIAFMVFFGLGTLPLLGGAAWAGAMLSPSIRQLWLSWTPVLIAIVGVLFIVRGLSLDIPFLSPSLLHLSIRADADCVVP